MQGLYFFNIEYLKNIQSYAESKKIFEEKAKIFDCEKLKNP